MQYLLSAVFAAMLVVAQTSWKLAVEHAKSPFHDGVSLSTVVGFVFSPLVILGIVVYALATGLYMFLLSRYQFSLVQSLAIPLSLIFSIAVAAAFFHESLSVFNYIGLALIVTGIVFVTLR